MEPNLLGCHSKHSQWGGAAACLGPPERSERNHLRQIGRLGLTPVCSAGELLTPSCRLCWMQHRSMNVWLCPIPVSGHFETLSKMTPHWTQEYSRRNFVSPLNSRLQVSLVKYMLTQALKLKLEFGSWELFDVLNAFCVVHRLEAFDLSLLHLFFLPVRVLFRVVEWYGFVGSSSFGLPFEVQARICPSLLFWSSF